MLCTSSGTAGSRWSVLVVDDDEGLVLMLRTLLSVDPRFSVAGEAGDGLEAVERARATGPDAIICDIEMPRMPGLEALPQLRSVCPDAAIVMFSGHDDVVAEALRLGADTLFPKSGDPIALLDLLGELCAGHRARR